MRSSEELLLLLWLLAQWLSWTSSVKSGTACSLQPLRPLLSQRSSLSGQSVTLPRHSLGTVPTAAPRLPSLPARAQCRGGQPSRPTGAQQSSSTPRMACHSSHLPVQLVATLVVPSCDIKQSPLAVSHKHTTDRALPTERDQGTRSSAEGLLQRAASPPTQWQRSEKEGLEGPLSPTPPVAGCKAAGFHSYTDHGKGSEHRSSERFSSCSWINPPKMVSTFG